MCLIVAETSLFDVVTSSRRHVITVIHSEQWLRRSTAPHLRIEIGRAALIAKLPRLIQELKSLPNKDIARLGGLRVCERCTFARALAIQLVFTQRSVDCGAKSHLPLQKVRQCHRR
jgi:hypothetical protein